VGRATYPHGARAAWQTDALDVLKQRVEDGVCTDQDLEGVGNTEVAPPQCTDARGDKCPALIAAGLSCATDFCAGCGNAGQCDLSCDLCGRRRAQTHPQTCTPDTFQAEAQGVTDACCDPGEPLRC
jgi:hypothetical protein